MWRSWQRLSWRSLAQIPTTRMTILRPGMIQTFTPAVFLTTCSRCLSKKLVPPIKQKGQTRLKNLPWVAELEAHFADPANLGCPDVATSDDLTEEQKSDIWRRLHVVTSLEQWRDIEADFLREALKFGVISLDNESVMQPKQEGKKLSRTERRARRAQNLIKDPEDLARDVILILVGTPVRVVIFDLRQLHPTGRTPENFAEALPESFLGVLKDPRVVKVGANIEDDCRFEFGHLGLEIRPVLDTCNRFDEARLFSLPDCPRATPGIDSLAHHLLGFKYKPEAVKDVFRIYQWTADLSLAQRSYLRNDALIVLQYVLNPVVRTALPEETLQQAIGRVWGDFISLQIDDSHPEFQRFTFEFEKRFLTVD